MPDGPTDAAAVRALAHPLRLQLLDLLRFEGPSTATLLGRQVGESSGSTSYHLRQLARYGFIEEAPGRGGRERWWRFRNRRVTLDSGGAGGRELLAELLSRETWALDHFLAQRRLLPEWDAGSFFTTLALRLTPAELVELSGEPGGAAGPVPPCRGGRPACRRQARAASCFRLSPSSGGNSDYALESNLARYAELIVRVGANVQPGQIVFVNGLVEHAPLVRAVTESAYAAGARYVDVHYGDQHVRKAFITHCADDDSRATWPWELARYQALADGAAVILISGDPEPELLADVDLARIGRARPLEGTKLYVQAVTERLINWTIAAYPTAGQARQVFGEPDVDRLWDAVAHAVRLDAADPVAAWNEHIEKLDRRERAPERIRLRRDSGQRPRHRPHRGTAAGSAVDVRRGRKSGRDPACREHADRGGLRLPRLAAHGRHRPVDASARRRRRDRARSRAAFRGRRDRRGVRFDGR